MKEIMFSSGRQRVFQPIVFLRALLLGVLLVSASYAADPGATQFEQGPNKFWQLKGDSKSFDPNNRHVSFVKKGNSNKSLMIYAHGGGGMGPADVTRARLFESFGFDVLSFDAFAMNGVEALWANRNLSDYTKQELVRKVMVGGIEHTYQVYENIVLYGQSNGAKVVIAVLNDLSEDKKAKIKVIISEAPAAWGLPLPNEIKIPIHFFVGSIDNWGGRMGEKDLMWSRFVPPVGSMEDWYKNQVRLGGPVHLTEYPGAGHSFHAGPVKAVTRKMAGVGTITGYLGAPPEVLRQYEDDLKKLVQPFLN